MVVQIRASVRVRSHLIHNLTFLFTPQSDMLGRVPDDRAELGPIKGFVYEPISRLMRPLLHFMNVT